MPPAKRRTASRSPARPAGATRSRRRALERRRDRRQLVTRLAFALVVLVLAGFALFRAATSSDSGSTATSTPGTTSAGGRCTADTRFDAGDGTVGNDHVYKVDPPAGGPYAKDSTPPGFYTDGKPVPTDAELVRAMRRGFTVLWYRTDLTDGQFEVIGSLSDQVGRDMILVPRRSLGGPVALTAWHARMLCHAVDAPAIQTFVKDHRDKGPEKGYL
ncbi:MAG TPA: DUF3105 domain-containing protein [Acidimicrobiales bacterium]|nr:DUF3105 domain-containing protein [Acidimicrobiales bacterium]